MEAKKNKNCELKGKSGLFFNIGLTASLLLVIMAFEWKFYDAGYQVVVPDTKWDFDEMIEIPPTEHKLPPMPRVQQPQVVEIPDKEEMPDDLLANFDVEIAPDAIVETIEYAAPPEEKTEEILDFPDYFPEPEEGIEAFYKAVSKALRYPRQAEKMGIEGSVYVQFVVNADGTLTDIQVMKGIGAGCDEEALRVIPLGGKWKPGKQNGRPVKVRMRLPIIFRIAN